MNYRYLTYDERRTIEELHTNGKSPAEIAVQVKKSVSTIYNELRKGYSGALDANFRPLYSAALAQQKTIENYRKRGTSRRIANES